MVHRIGHREYLGDPGCRFCHGDGFYPDTPETRLLNGAPRLFPRVQICVCRGGPQPNRSVNTDQKLDAKSRASGERDS
jgi:hypothetical protein